jgi:hypothetical protein
MTEMILRRTRKRIRRINSHFGSDGKRYSAWVVWLDEEGEVTSALSLGTARTLLEASGMAYDVAMVLRDDEGDYSGAVVRVSGRDGDVIRDYPIGLRVA